MAGVLFILFVAVPIIELYVLVQVASVIGALPAIALVLLLSFAGVWVAKREGISVARRVQDQLQRGEVPTTDLVNGLLILAAGLLMVFPGYVTAIAGLLLLFPPTRALVRPLVARRLRARIDTGFATPAGSMFRAGFGSTGSARVFTGTATYGGAGVMDVREVRTHDEPGETSTTDPPELGPR
jgi:UPF0716 protein FxsA